MTHLVLIEGSNTLTSGAVVDVHSTYVALEHIIAVKRRGKDGAKGSVVVMIGGEEFICNENADDLALRLKKVDGLPR